MKAEPIAGCRTSWDEGLKMFVVERDVPGGGVARDYVSEAEARRGGPALLRRVAASLADDAAHLARGPADDAGGEPPQ